MTVERPKDRAYRKKEKPPARVINMQLPVDLVDALEVMATDRKRDFHNMIVAALMWACWAHSHGRGPDNEMVGHGKPGYGNWDEKIRAKRETRELKRLFELEGDR